jgi:hypothetical protein
MAALSERDRKESNNELRTILLSHLTEDARGIMLDVGGGTGLLTVTLSDVFGQVVVLEPDLRKVEYGAKRRQEVGFIRGSAQGIPVAGGSIGTLVSVAAFHHFPGPGRRPRRDGTRAEARGEAAAGGDRRHDGPGQASSLHREPPDGGGLEVSRTSTSS